LSNIVPLGPGSRLGRWSRDGTRLAVARATVTNDIVLFKGLR